MIARTYKQVFEEGRQQGRAEAIDEMIAKVKSGSLEFFAGNYADIRDLIETLENMKKGTTK